jgi:hypothetical protein
MVGSFCVLRRGLQTLLRSLLRREPFHGTSRAPSPTRKVRCKFDPTPVGEGFPLPLQTPTAKRNLDMVRIQS